MSHSLIERSISELPPFSADLREKIKKYYQRYYQGDLGLPDWEKRVLTRQNEELVEVLHFHRAFGKAGDMRGKHFLNVGCGTGGMNVVAAQQGALTYGVEMSEEALDICRQKARETGIPEQNFVYSPAEKLPFPDNFFDFVHCLSVLEHVQDVQKAVQELVRVARPGGMIFIHVPNYLAFSENHYKIFWLPKLPKVLARLYLRFRGRPSEFINTLNYTTPGMIKACLSSESVTYEQAQWECNPSFPKRIYLKECFYRFMNITPGDFWIRKIAPEHSRSCGWGDFAVSVLVPQPWKYRFLSAWGHKVISHNAIAVNLGLFSGSGAEDYEERHLQNADAVDDLHTNAGTTGRLIHHYFHPGVRLLEVGCGTGFWSGHLLAKIQKAVVNDLSPDMIDTYRKRRTAQESAKIEAYQVGTVESLSRELTEKGQTFDRIVAISTLHHLEHRDQQMAWLWERLTPGGQLFFVEPCHNVKRLLRILRKLATEYRSPYIPSTHDFLTLSEVRRWVRQAGMQNARLVALKTTQFPLLGRLSHFPSLYLWMERFLQHIPVLRGQGNMIFAVLQKET